MSAHLKVVRPQGEKSQGPFEVSQSTIKTWRRCHAMYDYRHVQLLERKKPVIQLIRGTMIGKCADAMALRRVNPKAPKWETALTPFEKQYAKMFAAEQEYYGDPITEVKRIMARYEQIYAKDGLTYLIPPQKEGVLNSNTPYELPIRVDLAPGIVFTGHIDKMPRDKQGRVWDMDHKSHKNIPDHEARFGDLQQTFYQWAMPLSGYPKPAGVIWDYIRTKPPAIPETLVKGGLSQRQNIDTDYDTYMSEIVRNKLNPKDYKKILVPLKERGTMDFYQRVQLPTPNKAMIETIVADAKASALEMQKLGGVDKTRNMTRDCKGCEYYNLCQAELRGLDASFIRKSDYQINQDPRHVHRSDTNASD